MLLMFGASLVLGFVSGLTIFSQSIRLDESQSLWAASHTFEGVLRFVAQDVHTPLYPILLHVWLTAFGYNIITARILSLVFFLLSLVVLWLVLTENVEKRLILISFVVVTFSPFLVWYGSEARMYTLFMFFTLLNVLFYLRMVSQPIGGWQKWGVWYFLAGVGGVYTHYFFFLLLGVEAMYGLWRGISRQVEWKWVRNLALAQGGMLLALSPWIWFALKQGLFRNMAPSLTRPSLYGLMVGWVEYFIGYQSIKMTGTVLSLWPVAVLGVILFLTTWVKTKIKHVGFWLLWAVVPWAVTFVVSFWKPVFLPRYLIFTLPAILIVTSWIVVEVFRLRTRVWVLATIMIIMLGLFWRESDLEASRVVENYNKVALALNSEVGLTDKVVVSSPFTIIPLEYQFYHPNRIETIPKWNRYFPGPIPAFEMAKMEAQINEYKKTYTRLFVLLSYDQGYETKIQDYLDHNLERLDQKEYSTNMKLFVYRLRYDIDVPHLTAERP